MKKENEILDQVIEDMWGMAIVAFVMSFCFMLVF